MLIVKRIKMIRFYGGGTGSTLGGFRPTQPLRMPFDSNIGASLIAESGLYFDIAIEWFKQANYYYNEIVSICNVNNITIKSPDVEGPSVGSILDQLPTEAKETVSKRIKVLLLSRTDAENAYSIAMSKFSEAQDVHNVPGHNPAVRSLMDKASVLRTHNSQFKV